MTDVETGEAVYRGINPVEAMDAYLSAGGNELLLIKQTETGASSQRRSISWALYRHIISEPNSEPVALVEGAQSVAVSPDGKSVGWHSGYPDETTTVIDLSGRRQPWVQVIQDPDKSYVGMAMSPSGRRIARVYRYDVESAHLEILETRESERGKMQFALGNDRVADIVSFGDDNTLAVLAGQSVRILDLRGPDGPREKTRFPIGNSDQFWLSPDGAYFAAAEADMVTLWPIERSGRPQRLLHPALVSDLAFAAKFGGVVTASGTTAYGWNSRNAWRPGSSYGGRADGTSNPDGQYVIRRRGDTLSLHAVGKQQALRTLATSSLGRTHLEFRFSPRGDVLVGGNRQDPIRYWTVADGQEKTQVGETRGEPLAISPDGKFLASRVDDPGHAGGNIISIWAIETGNLVGRYTGHEPYGAFQLANTASFLLSSAFSIGSPTIWLWDIKRDEVIEDEDIMAAARVDHDVLIVRREAQQALVQSLGSNRTLATLPTEARRFYIDHGGRWVAATRRKNIEVWSIDGQEQLATIALQSEAEAIGFSQDGRHLAAITEEAAEVWRLTGGGIQVDRIVFAEPIGIPDVGFTGHVEFSQNNRFVQVMTEDGEVDRMWLWRPSDLIAEICAYVHQLDCGDSR